MSKLQFSKQELAFFEEGEALADQDGSDLDFSDLDEGERVDSWVDRALALLPIVGAARSQS